MRFQKPTKLQKFLEGFEDTLWAIECRFDLEYDSIDTERDENGRKLFMEAINVGWIEMSFYERRN